MAILLPCPKCGKRVNLQNDYAGKKWKCQGCRAKIRVPNPEKDQPGTLKCSCGNKIETWSIFIKEGVYCPACKTITKGGPPKEQELPEMIIVDEAEEETTQRKAEVEEEPVPLMSIDDIPAEELELVEDLELIEDFDMPAGKPEQRGATDRRTGENRRKGDRRKGERRKGDRRQSDRRD